MSSVSVVANLPTIRTLDRPGTAPRGRAIGPITPPTGCGRGHGPGTQGHYRVDDSYRNDWRNTRAWSSRAVGDGAARLIKISSAELLDSMIQRMGGAYDSRPKGAYVDIVV